MVSAHCQRLSGSGGWGHDFGEGLADAAAIHGQGAGLQAAAEDAAFVDANGAGADDLAGETAIDFEGFGFEGIGQFHCGLVTDQGGFCRGFEGEFSRP